MASYGADLAIKHGNDFRAVVNSAEYRDIFPRMRISALKNTQTEVVTTLNGSRLATSVDGAQTGRGGDIIIIDDPISALAAMSQNARDHVRDWYFTLPSRLDDQQNGAIVLVMQRLHEDDLTGVLLRGSDEWTVLSLPAIAEQDEQIPIGNGRFHLRHAGDVLHPERASREVLESLRAEIGEEPFAAQFQQQPVAPGGALIKRDWPRRYDQLPKSGRIIQSWDVANKQGEDNDYSVCTTWLNYENRYYLVDVLRRRFDFPSLRTMVSEQAKLHKASHVLIEEAGVAIGLIQDLKSADFSLIPVKPEYDKKIRMEIQSVKFASGQVFFPKEAPWLADLEAELFAFPKGRHDDQVDSISQALGYKIPSSLWTDASIKGFNDLTNALCQDAMFRRDSPAVHGDVRLVVCSSKANSLASLNRHAELCGLSIDKVWTSPSATEVEWSTRQRAAQSTLKWAAVQPKVDLHREPGVLDRAVQIASTGEADAAADRAQ